MNPWAILGLPPGADRDAIRRAYARKLKGVNPEDDPEGFMQLRAAHDAALAQLKWRTQWPDDDGDAGDADPLAADPPPEAAPAPVVPMPPDPEPVAVAIDPLAAERAADRADLAARQQALIDVIAAGGEQAAQHAALDRLLAAPALIDIMARDRIEPWVAQLLARQLPASDPVVVHAIERFGWAELPASQISPDVDRLLRRREEGEFVANIARRHTPLHVGYLALRDPPPPRWWGHLKALFSAAPEQTRRILGLADGPMPGIADWLNADAMAWWRDYHAIPRLRLWMLLVMVPLASVLLVAALDGAGWPEAAQAGVSLLAWAAPWGLLWLLRRRQAWQDDWGRPDWHYRLWPLPLLALPVLAAVWPALPMLNPLFLVAVVAAAGWMIMAADTVQPTGWRDLAPGLVRSLPAWLFLMLMIGGAPLEDGLGPVRGLALFGLALAWWQAGDQLAWMAQRTLANRLDGRAQLAPWLLLAAGAAVALLALGLGLADRALVGRALVLLALPLLAALAALRICSGWHQLGPGAALLGLALLLFGLLAQVDPSIAGPDGLIAGLGSGSWLIDPRTGLPRTSLIFLAVFGITTLWRSRRGEPVGSSWLLRFLLVAVAISIVASVMDRRPSQMPPLSSANPPVRHEGRWAPARPLGDTRDWVDLASMDPPPPPGRFSYEVRLAVTPQGRVAECSLSRSTGNAVLDANLCRQLRARARFTPGRNDAGVPMRTVEFLNGRLERPAPAAPAAAAAPPPPIRCPADSGTGPMVAEPCMPDRWFFDGSYPAVALAAGHSGTVEYGLAIGADGRVADCRILRSSGHASLDQGTCALLRRRARFVPARDVDGSPMDWDYRGSIRWELERD